MAPALLLQHIYHAGAASSHVGVASRVLRRASNGAEAEHNCEQLKYNAAKVLNEFYQPASFDCECVSTWGGFRSSAGYQMTCNTYASVSRRDPAGSSIFAYITWDATFNRMMPTEERACINYYSEDCQELDNKQVCYYFDYGPSNPHEQSSPPDFCSVTVDDQMCGECHVCDGTDAHEGAHYTAANCASVPGMEGLSYQCHDVETTRDIRDLVFTCPRITVMEPEPRVHPPPPPVYSKSSKSKSSKQGKSRRIQ